MVLTLPKNIKVWGLTGGMGSGKSLAAKYFEEAGIPVINLDLLGREILDKDSSVQQDIKEIFGESVLNPSGVNRSAIREIAFRDKTKREALEKLLHPRIWELFKERAGDKAKEGAKLLLCEAALLIEHDHAKLFPKLIVVMANEDIRRKRVVERDKMNPELFNEVLKSQTNDKTRKKLASHLVVNEGDAVQLKLSINSLISHWKQEGIL